MTRFGVVGAAIATAVALTVSVLVGSAEATTPRPTAHHAASVWTAKADTAGPGQAPKLKIKRSAASVQAGVVGEKITAVPGGAAKGKVRFILRGHGLKQARKVRITNGRAVFEVPPLSAGAYKVRASYRKLRGQTEFDVS